MSPPKVVLFACVHNAGRSQMAAAWFNELADPAKARAISAGTSPGSRVHPEVVTAMNEVGVDLSDGQPRFLSDELASTASLLVTMGCGQPALLCPDSSVTTGRSRIPKASQWSEFARYEKLFASESRPCWGSEGGERRLVAT